MTAASQPEEITPVPKGVMDERSMAWGRADVVYRDCHVYSKEGHLREAFNPP